MGEMILAGRASFGFGGAPFVARVERGGGLDDHRLRPLGATSASPWRLRVGRFDEPPAADEVQLPSDFSYVAEGDLLRLNPAQGKIRTLYRRNSAYNTLFLTERCNSHCLMCSQPPRTQDDSFLTDEILLMLPWMSQDTQELGITGGEPTLLHGKLLQIIKTARDSLPRTALHMLSNGRLFSYLKYAEQLALIRHPDFVVGVPLYADTAATHDFVVQARGAFDQTLFGILNLGRTGVDVELRVVVHRQTYGRLPQIARFIARNLPFVRQVAFMGLELMGFARSNLDQLWIDPVKYQNQLEKAVTTLEEQAIPVAIYNHPLCLLRLSVRKFARKSISDWKNIYLPQCEGCDRKSACGGFFASAASRHSGHVNPVTSGPGLYK